MDSVHYKKIDISEGTTTFNIPNGYRGRLTIIATSTTAKGDYLIAAYSNGNLNCRAILEAANVTAMDTSVANKLTITSNLSVTCVFETYAKNDPTVSE